MREGRSKKPSYLLPRVLPRLAGGAIATQDDAVGGFLIAVTVVSVGTVLRKVNLVHYKALNEGT